MNEMTNVIGLPSSSSVSHSLICVSVFVCVQSGPLASTHFMQYLIRVLGVHILALLHNVPLQIPCKDLYRLVMVHV